MRLQPGDARLAVDVRAQRRGEAEVVELRRAQAERELTHTLEHVLHGIDAFLDTRARRKLARTAARQRLELDFERRERLPHVVVQVAREAAALLFLHLEQAPRQRAQALVRELELAIQALERLLRAQALGDVVDLHQARRTAAPRDQVSHALDVDHLAGLFACRNTPCSTSPPSRRRKSRNGISSPRLISEAVMARNSLREYS